MRSSFDIQNRSEKDLIISHEPECFEFALPPNETVTIVFNSCIDSLFIRHHITGDKIGIDIIEDNSQYRVIHNGIDVFEKYMD